MSRKSPHPGDEIINHPTLSTQVFFPRPDRPDTFFPVQCGQHHLACWHERPFPRSKTVVHFHGNGETVADYVPDLAEVFLERELNLFLVEYRGYGASSGTPSFGGILDDVAPIFDTIGLPADQLIVFGRSLGSVGAIELAMQQPNIAGLILESGIAYPPERILLRMSPEEFGLAEDEVISLAEQRLHHERKLSTYSGPKLVMHAEDDSLLEVSNGKRLHDYGGGKDKQLVLFPRGDHNGIMMVNWEAYWQTIDEFIEGL